jgi:hypothetical protein
MTFLSMWTALKPLPRQARLCRRRQRHHAPPPIRPRLEVLEDRLTPAVFTPTVFSDGTAGGTLREAITNANNDPGTATDTVQLSAGTYMLTIPNTANNHDVSGTQGDLNVTGTAHALVIQGTTDANGNPTSIIRQTVADRVLQILNLNGGAAATVTLKNVIIDGGNAQDDGSAGAVAGQSDALGGGIMDDGGNLTLINVVVQNNRTTAGAAFSAQGGGVFARAGSLTITNSFIQKNSITDNGGGATAGGGVFYNGDTCSISGSTLSDNVVVGGDGGGAALFGSDTIVNSTIANNGISGSGGGIFFEQGATGQLTNDTVAGNGANAGGGLSNDNGSPRTVTLVNTVVAKNTSQAINGVPNQDLTAQFTSGGHNLIGIDNNLKGPTDLAGTAASPLDPKLGPLQNNGGTTPTMLPLAGSPLLGAGDPSLAPSTDQRGQSRPSGGPIDVGAVQVSGSASTSPSPTTSPSPSAGPKPAPTLHTPSLLSFFDHFFFVTSTQTVNPDGTVTVTDSLFGMPFLVSTYDSSGNLTRVLLFGSDVTTLFKLFG